MSEFFFTNQPLIEAILINIGLAFSQYVVLRAGVFSVATIGLAGVGAYTAGLFTVRLGAPYPVALLAGMVTATACSLLLGWPLARLRGVFQAVATLAFVLVVQTVAFNLPSLTGGSLGLIGIPRKVETWHLIAFVAVMAFLLVNLGRTRPGRAFDAINSEETAAVAHGINVRKYQFMAFGLSGLFAGIAGGLLAHQNYTVEPTQFGFIPTIDVLIYVVLGGTVSVLGPIVGTTVFMALPEIARPFESNRDVIVGVILILVVLYLPDGMVDSARRRLRERRVRRKHAQEPDVERPPDRPPGRPSPESPYEGVEKRAQA